MLGIVRTRTVIARSRTDEVAHHRTRIARARTVIAVVSVWGASVMGCSDAESVRYYDSDGLEAVIPGELVPDRPDLVTGVACPEMVAQRSVSVSCTAEIGGVAVDVDVAVDGRGRADLSIDDVFLVDVAELVARGERKLADDDFGPVALECDGPPVLVAVAGRRLECDAVDRSGDRHPLVVTITSEDGAWADGSGVSASAGGSVCG